MKVAQFFLTHSVVYVERAVHKTVEGIKLKHHKLSSKIIK